MSKLSVISFSTYLTDIDIKWRSIDWTSNKIVKALKEDEFQGYFVAKIDGKRRRLESGNASAVLPLLHQIVAQELVKRFPKGVTLVPIPNSHVVKPETEDFRTRKFAEGISAVSNGLLECAPVLVFSEALPKTHSSSGPRDPHFLQDRYRLVGKLESPVVLIDDVYTSGGHLVAAAWLLRDNKIEVPMACTWAKATNQQREKVALVEEDELELDRGIAEFGDFISD